MIYLNDAIKDGDLAELIRNLQSDRELPALGSSLQDFTAHPRERKSRARLLAEREQAASALIQLRASAMEASIMPEIIDLIADYERKLEQGQGDAWLQIAGIGPLLTKLSRIVDRSADLPKLAATRRAQLI